MSSPFAAVLREELSRRCAKNARYSLRAFARTLGLDHATLSQLMRGKRRLTPRTAERLGRKLGLDAEALRRAAAPARPTHGEQLANEAALVLTDGLHAGIVALVRTEGFTPDARSIARALGVTADDVNVAVQRLLHFGLLELRAEGRWYAPDHSASDLERAVWSRVASQLSQPAVKQESPMPAVAAQPVQQFQILSRNPDAAAKFYGQLFGWKVNDANPLGYRQLSTGGISGGIWPAPPSVTPFVQLFVAVDDVHAAVERASALGARVAVPPQTLPEGDEMAVLVDTEGISFGVFKVRTKA